MSALKQQALAGEPALVGQESLASALVPEPE